MEHVKSITAIASTTARGQKVTAVCIAYDREVDGASVSPEKYLVKDRTILAACVTDGAAPGRPAAGNCVMLQLDPMDPAAQTYQIEDRKGPRPKPEDMSKLPPRKVDRLGVHAAVKQAGDIAAADGTRLAQWDGWQQSGSARQLIVDDFQHGLYRDQDTGEEMMYSLYIPKGCEGKQLPLVVFIGDASTRSDDWDWSLVSVSGGVVWASPEDQAKHPCYVLVPQISGKYGSIVNDFFETTPDCETVQRLIHHIMDAYPIDRKRVYGTGQSMGCMTFCEINCREPDLLAASLLVAGQWDPQRMARTCAHNNLWIIVSEGDEKAFPGMNAVTQAMEQAGAHIVRGYWNARMSQEEYRAAVDQMSGQTGIHYSVLDAGTVLDADEDPRRGHHHQKTWKIIYHVDALRDWLLSQSR